ncbi:transposon Tf2-9 polyprotein [Trichonephila clavipes]|nr:transposon Tf2-9 polyprotein [Trichonephila clavipes]
MGMFDAWSPADRLQLRDLLFCLYKSRSESGSSKSGKDTPFEWTSETQEAFDDIKKAILNPPVLALPDPNAELQITTDALSRGIGAILEQKYPNSEVKPLYFFLDAEVDDSGAEGRVTRTVAE